MPLLTPNPLVYFLLFALVLGENNETERETRVINGKTYFVQLRKIKGDEDEAVYVRTKTNLDLDKESRLLSRYEDLFGRLGDLPENLKERNPEDLIQNLVEDQRPSYIDRDWGYNVNHSSLDLPNITHEIYEAMLESNRHNTIVNASMVKFFFESDTDSTSNVVKFNLDSLKTITERIIDAELHVYRLKRNETKPNSSDNVVRLYQMTETSAESDESNSTTESSLNPDIHKLANVIYISSNYEGWQVFKVKNVIENWRSGEENLGFLISTTDSAENEDSVEFAHRQRNGGKYQPTLIVYLDTTKKDKLSKPPRRPHSKSLRLSHMLSRSYNPCSRHIWYISFHELGWNNFILAPAGYMAYKCSGDCHSLAGAPYTNHGKMVSMLQQGQRRPCCVPDGYGSLLVMFLDREANVVIKEVEEMVVDGCSCR